MMFMPNSSTATTQFASNNFSHLNHSNQQLNKHQQSANPWTITAQEHQQNEAQFVVLRPVDGLIGGEQARPFFLKSGLPALILAQIWQLADVNKDGKLDRFEFSIAMKLVLNCLAGISLPSVLPESMLRIGGGMSISSTSSSHSLSNGGGPSTALPSSLSQQRPMSTYGSMPAMASSYQRPYGSFSAAQTPVTTNSTPFLMGIKELGDWSLPQPMKLRFCQKFNQLDKSRIGLLTGQQARGVLGESQLPTNVLAQIWTMSDVNKDGCLSIEEFCTAMFLIEMVKAGYALPSKLPNELHSFCNRSKTVSPSTMATEDDPSAPPPQKPGHGQFKTFEDKRKDNLDKGQAELERRRRILREEEERRRAEIERREREEAERKERERMELERRREAEMEEERQREMARERERAEQEQRLKAKREEIRERMEQERIQELEKIRIRDLGNQLQAETEKSTQIQQRQHTMAFQLQALEERSQQLNGEITEARDAILEITQEIERMRGQRDQKLARIGELERNNKELAVQCERFSHENLQHQSEVQRQLTRMNEISEIHTEIAQLNDQIQQGENAIETIAIRSQNQEKLVVEKRPNWEESCKNVQSVRDLFTEMLVRYNKGRGAAGVVYEMPPDSKESATTHFGQQGTSNTQPTQTFSVSFDDDFKPDFSNAFGAEVQQKSNEKIAAGNTELKNDAIVQNGDKLSKDGVLAAPNEQQHGQVTGQVKTVKYKALFEFNARSADELSIQPGDQILVFEGHQSEPGWLAGQIRDKVGWFPASFAEPLSSAPSAAVPLTKRGGSLAGSPSGEPLASIREECEPPPSGQVQCMEQRHTNAFEADFTSAFTKSASFTESSTIGKATETAQPKDSFLTMSVSRSVSAALYDLPPSDAENVVKPANNVQAPRNTIKPSSVPLYEMPPDSEKMATKSIENVAESSAADDIVLSVGMALYQWKARNEQEMSFGRGDVIEVLEQGEMRWRGRLQKNRQIAGWFPKSYIKVGAVSSASLGGGDSLKEEDNAPTRIGLTGQIATKDSSEASESGEWFIALYQFDAVETTDLSLKPGDRIWVTDQRDQWWRGTCNGKSGIFPANYVQKTGEVASLVQKDSKTDGQTVGRAIATFTATSSNQIPLVIGDIVKIHQRTPGGWWEGEVEKGGVKQIGWFPGNYIQVLNPSNETVTAVAAFDYNAQHEDELTFKLGDIIEVVDHSDSFWWKGRKKGQSEQNPMLFPANFVQLNK